MKSVEKISLTLVFLAFTIWCSISGHPNFAVTALIVAIVIATW